MCDWFMCNKDLLFWPTTPLVPETICFCTFTYYFVAAKEIFFYIILVQLKDQK